MNDGRRLPSFLVIGAMKAGTSSLYEYLRGHPQIYMPNVKEPQFFASNWDRGLDWYASLFEGAAAAGAVGEASTEYTKHPYFGDVPARITHVLGDVRMVYLVRDPVERIVSEYLHRASTSREEAARPIDRAVLEDPSYVDFSRYAMQLEQYFEHFPGDRILVLRSEDLRDDRARTVRRVLAFLGVDDRWVPSNLEHTFHTSSDVRHRRQLERSLRRAPGYRAVAAIASPAVKRATYRWMTRPAPEKPSMSEGVVQELRERLRDDVVQLRAYLGAGFDGWGIA